MTLVERIKKIRKDNHLSQTEFGERIGVTRSVINNIELDRNKNGIPENIIKLIVLTFNVREEWLRYGVEPMLNNVTENNRLIDKVANEYNLDNFQKKLVEEYLNLTNSQKNAVKSFLDKIYSNEIVSETNNELSATKEAEKIPPEYANLSAEEIKANADFWDKLYEKRLASSSYPEDCENIKMAWKTSLNKNYNIPFWNALLKEKKERL